MKARFLIMIMVLSILVVLTGCGSITGNQGGPPDPFDFGMIAECNGTQVQLMGAYIGTDTYMYVDFYTGNTSDDFEMSVLIDTPSVPPEYRPPPIKSVKFTVNKKETYSAKGIMRAAVYMYSPCYSEGPYEVTFIITDPHGDSGFFQMGFDIEESPTCGSDPCKCVSQCGECTNSRYDVKDRCLCGCQFYYEKCE